MVRRRPRFAGTLAVLTAVVVLAAACSGGSDDTSSNGDGSAASADLPTCPLDALDAATQPVDITVWHSQVAEPQKTFEALVAEYNASQTRVRVSLESQGASFEELVRKFTQAIPTRQLPAAVVVDDTSTQFMVDSGVVLPAQSCIDATGYDMSPFVETAVDYYTVDGAVYPASANLGAALTYYNKNHFRRAGLDPEDPPTNLAEMRATAEAIKAAGVAETPMVYAVAPWIFEFWMTGAGSSIVDNDNGRSGDGAQAATLAGNTEATELLQWMSDMQADGLLEVIPYAEGQINQYLALASQSSSFLVESSSAATSVASFLAGTLDITDLGASTPAPADTSSLDIGAGPFAGIQTGGRGQIGGNAWYMTNTGSPEVLAATWDFMTFLNSEDAQAQLAVGGSYLPYREAAAEDPRVVENWTTTLSGRWLAIANQMVVDGIDPAFPGPLIGPYTETRLAIRNGLEALTVDGVTPEVALDRMQTELDAAFQRYRDEGF